jgi:hypothetical protein
MRPAVDVLAVKALPTSSVTRRVKNENLWKRLNLNRIFRHGAEAPAAVARRRGQGPTGSSRSLLSVSTAQGHVHRFDPVTGLQLRAYNISEGPIIETNILLARFGQ